ncbi:MAG: TerB family tellurite resistance protein [Pseudomonadota bacterium]|nr:TerB family tellurite resistance protein [Pseudomonadota bacterium]
MATIRGKVIGGILGFVVGGGPVGAAAGIVIGHMYDTGPEMLGRDPWTTIKDSYSDFHGTTEQSAFTMGVIVLGAKMAKADGRVSRAEIEAFKRVFKVAPAQEQSVGKLFNRARTSASGFEPYAFQLSNVFQQNPAVLEEILGGLFIIAAADNNGLSPVELTFLKRVAIIFNMGGESFARIAARAGVRLPGEAPARSEEQEAYDILGVKVESSAEEIKNAYRALIREHHPDRLIAQGVPPEFVATANEKMKRINVAYDRLCKSRGIK